jgi:hypothetical protein
MGDTPTSSQPIGNFSNAPQSRRTNFSQSSSQGLYGENYAVRTVPQGFPSPPPQTGYPPMQFYLNQQHVQHSASEAFNMNSLGTALPDPSYQGYGYVPPQRYSQGLASPGAMYQLQNAPQYTGALTGMNPSSVAYNIQYRNQYLGLYVSGHTQSAEHLQTGTAPGSQYYYGQGFAGQPQQQQVSPHLMHPSQYGPPSRISAGSPPQYGMRSSFSGDSRLSGQQRTSEHLRGSPGSGLTGRSTSNGGKFGQHPAPSLSGGANCLKLEIC